MHPAKVQMRIMPVQTVLSTQPERAAAVHQCAVSGPTAKTGYHRGAQGRTPAGSGPLQPDREAQTVCAIRVEPWSDCSLLHPVHKPTG